MSTLIMTLKTDLAIKLAEAIKGIPEFKYTGKILLTDDEIDTMKDMSPREMAIWWGNKHDLKPKNKILVILQEIFRRNQEGKLSYPAMQRMKDLELNYRLFIYLFRIGGTPLISSKGKRAGTKYRWTKPNVPPIFSDAEDLFNVYQELKKYQLNPKQRLLVDRNPDEEIDALLKILNINDEKEIEFARFRLLEIKERQANKDRKEGTEEPKKEHIITSHETRTVLKPMNGARKEDMYPITIQESVIEDQLPTNGESTNRVTTTANDLTSSNGEGELFILNERLKLYKAEKKNLEKHNKYLKKHNKALTNKILELTNSKHDGEGKNYLPS